MPVIAKVLFKKGLIKRDSGFSLQELLVVIAVIGLLAGFSFYSWDLLYGRIKLRAEINKFSDAIRLAYKDAVSKEIYIGVAINYYSNQNDHYLIYWERNGIIGFQEDEDEIIVVNYLPQQICIESIGGFNDNIIMIEPSGILIGKFDSKIYPGYVHIMFKLSKMVGLLRISKIGELSSEFIMN